MPENNNRPTPAAVIATPGDLLANIPGILGFYPRESVVFTAMYRKPRSYRFELGPVIRVDLDELRYLPEISSALNSAEVDMVFAFVIGPDTASATCDQAVEQLFESSEPELLDIAACWVTPGIYSGEVYQLAFGPPPEALENDPSGLSDWENGRIPPITEAAATRSMLSGGHLPEVTRDEAFAAFDRGNTHLTPHVIHELESQVEVDAGELMQGVFITGEEFFAHAIDRFGVLVDRCEGLTMAETLVDTEMLGQAAAYLVNPLTRDAVMHFFVERPAAASDLGFAIAKTFDGVVRANALCLYSLAVVRRNLGMKTNPALEAALRTAPGHNLSVLLRHGLNEGRFDETIEACLRGNAMVREQYAGKGQSRGGCTGTAEAA
ncbi:DUF4192 domain-containing protein [Corynebacterium pacaense]|uniref:DUF4192 domain-containing protein n=1 Tax=Corynebacterium pacaense TaxID=1816684 RepID=UPI0009B9C88C|nr:DUF4192 domain-containing protein [Corynebacterium pacaense]